MARPELAAVALRSAHWTRRVSTRIALALIFALVSSAVFAPLIANDRPLYLRAVDRGAYEDALGSLDPVASSWYDKLLLCVQARETARSRPDGVQQLHRASQELTREMRALELRLATLRRFVTAGERRPIDEVEHLARGWTNNVFQRRSDDFEAARRVVERSRALAESLAGVALVPRSSFPALASLSGGAWWFVWAWPFFVVLLLRRARWRSHLFGAGAAVVLAWLATAAAAAPPTLVTASFKEGLASAAIRAERAVFAPFPYGYGETNLSESFRPPTWQASAEIDAAGRYVRGARAVRPDPTTGFMPASTPVEVRFAERTRNCPWRHPLGTDSLGRDVLTRLVWGGRVSLLVGFASVVLAVAFGVAAGVAAGYLRGAVDSAVLASVGLLQAFPTFLLILVAVALWSDRLVEHPEWAVVAVIGCVGWTGIARLVRAEALRASELDYVLAARALGFSDARVLLRHVLPNSLAPVYVAAAFAVTSSILIESATSFLGFGVRPPTPSWGAVLRDSQSGAHWWILVFPGLAVFVTCLACNWVGDALRDAHDPREAR